MKQWLSLQTITKEYADLSERKLRAFLSHPTHPLPARLVGGKWLVCREDLDQWLRSFPRAGEDIDRLVEEVMREMKGKRHGQM